MFFLLNINVFNELKSVSQTRLCLSTDSDYENANRSADVDVELMAFQSIIGDDYKGLDLFVL